MTELIRRHSLLAYFGLTFLWSWGTALAILGPRLLSGEPIPTWLGLTTFPAMILGPALAGIVITAAVDGRAGLADLLTNMRRVRFAPRWYAIACLLAPGVLQVMLCAMAVTISPVFAPGLFPLGVVFGPIAGFFEEIGWSGFAYPRLRQRYGAIGGGVLLGLIWGVWHLPVLDFMGTASPHGAYFPAFWLHSSRWSRPCGC